MIRPLVLLPLLLGGCVVEPTLPSTCVADEAVGYVGQRYTPTLGQTVKRKTRSVYLRALAPDTIVTMEFNAKRVNVAHDESGIVTRIYCG